MSVAFLSLDYHPAAVTLLPIPALFNPRLEHCFDLGTVFCARAVLVTVVFSKASVADISVARRALETPSALLREHLCKMDSLSTLPRWAPIRLPRVFLRGASAPICVPLAPFVSEVGVCQVDHFVEGYNGGGATPRGHELSVVY